MGDNKGVCVPARFFFSYPELCLLRTVSRTHRNVADSWLLDASAFDDEDADPIASADNMSID